MNKNKSKQTLDKILNDDNKHRASKKRNTQTKKTGTKKGANNDYDSYYDSEDTEEQLDRSPDQKNN